MNLPYAIEKQVTPYQRRKLEKAIKIFKVKEISLREKNKKERVWLWQKTG